jgi:deoxycytidylate deaminase
MIDMFVKQCNKQTTVAVIMRDGYLVSIGTNAVGERQAECPRRDMPTGVGYELCKTICKQESHAEVTACHNAGEEAQGGTLYLIGHTYVCDDCMRVIVAHGIKEVIIARS